MRRSLFVVGTALSFILLQLAAGSTGLAQDPKPSPGTPKPDDKKPEDKKPDDKKPEEKKSGETKTEEKKSDDKKGAKEPPKIKPYDDIVTNAFKTSPGLFFVHKSEDKLLYEIPLDAMGKDMVWVRSIEKASSGSGYGGSPLGERVVRWEQRGDDVLLRDVKYDIRADTKDPISFAVECRAWQRSLGSSP